MMTLMATDFRQSQRLLACGLSGKTADMCRIHTDEEGNYLSLDEVEEMEEDGEDTFEDLIPIIYSDYDHSHSKDDPSWSLASLFNLLPRQINGDHICIKWVCDKWCITYNSVNGVYDADLLEACVKMHEHLHKFHLMP